MNSRIATTIAIGTSSWKASAPMPALPNSTMRISSVAYAVDDTASEAKIGRATFLESFWWPSSAVAIGRAEKDPLDDRHHQTGTLGGRVARRR